MGIIKEEMEIAIVDKPANSSNSNFLPLLSSNLNNKLLLPEEFEYSTLLSLNKKAFKQ